jgi:hypothetical protein
MPVADRHLKKLTGFRFSAVEMEELDEVAKQLGLNRTEALRHAIFQLRRATGLLGEDVIRLHERLARMEGDDAELVFVVTSIERQAVDVCLGEDVRTDLQANVLYVAAAFADQPPVLPPGGLIVMKDLETGAWYTIGEVELREGAEKRVPIRELSNLIQGANDDRTPEQRRSDIEMSATIRRAAGIEAEADE